jgi:hypothetical protein
LLSLAFTLAAVALTFVAARQLRPGDDALALLAAGLMAFNPMVVFMSGVVQNDAAALAAGAACAVVLGGLLRHPPPCGAGCWPARCSGWAFCSRPADRLAPLGAVALYQAWPTQLATLVRRPPAGQAGALLPGGGSCATCSSTATSPPTAASWRCGGPPAPSAWPCRRRSHAATGFGRLGNGGVIEFSRPTRRQGCWRWPWPAGSKGRQHG